MGRKFAALRQDERGATAVEYALIVSLIVLALVGALRGVAATTINMWGYVSDSASSSAP